MPRIVVTRRIDEHALALLRDAGEVEMWDSDLPPPTEELRRLLRGQRSLESKVSEGGTSLARVREQLQLAHGVLDDAVG